jgi:biopolymer transport protein TolQ
MTHLFCSSISSIALLLFQADDAGTAAPSPVHGANAIVEMLANSGPIALVVLGILVLASLFSWAIILGKWSGFRKARSQSRLFLRAFRKAARLQEVAAVSEQYKPSPLVNVFDEVYDTYRRQTGGFGPPRNITALERTAQSASSEALTYMEHRLTWLATIGATAPFVGLFGTVMGIVDAFHGLGTAGAATLRAVAPGVSEALITTAAGLVVAVPAVVAYNQFSARIREFGSRMDDFARELLNSMEEISLRPGQDPLEREVARDPQREYPRELYREPVREQPYEYGREGSREPARDAGREPGREGTREPGRGIY